MSPLMVGTPPATAPVEARVLVAPKKMVKSTSRNNAPTHIHVGLSLVTSSTSPDPLPLSGDSVSSLIVMTNPDVGSEPEVAETNVHSTIEGNKAASAHAAKPKAKPGTHSAEAAGPAGAADRVVKPKLKPKEPNEVLPWLRPR
jgi:hypothetical protein